MSREKGGRERSGKHDVRVRPFFGWALYGWARSERKRPRVPRQFRRAAASARTRGRPFESPRLVQWIDVR